MVRYHLGRLRGLVSCSRRCSWAEKAARWVVCLMMPDVCESGAAVRRVA